MDEERENEIYNSREDFDIPEVFRRAMEEAGWRVLIIWECAIKGKARLQPDVLIDETEKWLLSGGNRREIDGTMKRAG